MEADTSLYKNLFHPKRPFYQIVVTLRTVKLDAGAGDVTNSIVTIKMAHNMVLKSQNSQEVAEKVQMAYLNARATLMNDFAT